MKIPHLFLLFFYSSGAFAQIFCSNLLVLQKENQVVFKKKKSLRRSWAFCSHGASALYICFYAIKDPFEIRTKKGHFGHHPVLQWSTIYSWEATESGHKGSNPPPVASPPPPPLIQACGLWTWRFHLANIASGHSDFMPMKLSLLKPSMLVAITISYGTEVHKWIMQWIKYFLFLSARTLLLSNLMDSL